MGAVKRALLRMTFTCCELGRLRKRKRLIDHEVAAIHLKKPPALPMAATSVCRRALLVSPTRPKDLTRRGWLIYSQRRN